LKDFELFIVGDGMSEPTRAVAVELASADPRIRLFDYPKGERKGERHRHDALRRAAGTFVAYLGDDDLWMPHHLSTVVELLADADFGNTLNVGIGQDGALRVVGSDLADPRFRQRMLDKRVNSFDMTFGAHRLAAYRRLAEGWAPPPQPFKGSDHYLWHRFLAEPWCRARTAQVPTGICTHTHLRPGMGDDERAAELAKLALQLEDEGFRQELGRLAAEAVGRQRAASRRRRLKAPLDRVWRWLA
jgi:hypothetical protein